MRGRRRWTAALLVPWLLLAGCWDRRDPERMAWVSAVGVDKGPKNDYIFTFHLPVMPAAGGPGGGGGGGQQPSGGGVDVYAVEAPDIITALDVSQSFVARRVTLTHAKTLVIGEAVAKEDVTPIVSAATRFQEFRRNLTVMVARGKAFDFLNNTRPRLETNSSRWFEMLQQTHAETGIIPMTTIHDFVLETERGGVGARATLVAFRPDVASGEASLDEESQGTAGAPPTVGSAKAGHVRRLKELPVEFIGEAVFKKARLAGILSGDDTRLAAMLRGEFKQAAMALIDPNAPDRRLVFRLSARTRPQLRVQRSGNRVQVHFLVPLAGELVSVQSITNYADPVQRAKLETSAAQQFEQRLESVLKKTLNQWGTDLFFIANELRATFPTESAWEAFNWGQRIYQTTADVDVRFQVRRFGLQAEPSTPRE